MSRTACETFRSRSQMSAPPAHRLYSSKMCTVGLHPSPPPAKASDFAECRTDVSRFGFQHFISKTLSRICSKLEHDCSTTTHVPAPSRKGRRFPPSFCSRPNVQCPAQQLSLQYDEKLPNQNHCRFFDLFVRSCMLYEGCPQPTNNSTSPTNATKEMPFSLLRDVSGASGRSNVQAPNYI